MYSVLLAYLCEIFNHHQQQQLLFFNDVLSLLPKNERKNDQSIAQ